MGFCGTPVSSTNKTDRHDIIEILLKVALTTKNQTKPYDWSQLYKWRLLIYTSDYRFGSF